MVNPFTPKSLLKTTAFLNVNGNKINYDNANQLLDYGVKEGGIPTYELTFFLLLASDFLSFKIGLR